MSKSQVTHLDYDDISRTNNTLEILTEYWFKCGRPTGILFPSSWTRDYLVRDSVIQFFRASAKKAGISKNVSTHCLRHSFASHLFEFSCDTKYIQALLGHRDPRSTEIYLHVSNKTLLGIKSPFDEMGGGLDAKNRWKIFLPYGVISKIFRGKYLEELKQLWNDSKLEFHRSAKKYKNRFVFKELLNTCYKKEWVTYCKETFNGAQSVISYRGKYTHRIAIGNHRIKNMTACRNLIGCQKYISKLKNMNAVEMIKELYNIDICKCSHCGGKMVLPKAESYISIMTVHMRC